MSEGISGSFPPTDEAQWRRLVEQVLEGRPFHSLISMTFEGLEIQPLYMRRPPGRVGAVRQEPGPWLVSQRIDHPDPELAAAQARTELDAGADALTLVVAGAPAARGFGVSVHSSKNDLELALTGIDLDLVPLRLDAGHRTLDIARALAAIADDRRLTSAALDVDFGHDPIGCFSRVGALGATPEHLGREAAAILALLRDHGFTGRLLLADGRPYHEAGAGESQELACVLATAVTYLRLLESAGLELEEARDQIGFLLVGDADQFLTLAKFRALRRLWARVERACALAPKPVRLHAETGFRMMTARDPWTNILRTTIAAVSAGLAGADAITVLPFTLALGLPDAFARRIARNTQLVSIHEAKLGTVADPAAGSAAIETLTHRLCERAWGLFQRIERQGGMIASLEAGLPQAEIGTAAAARRAAIARGTFAITGSSAFPDLAETPVHVDEPARSEPLPIPVPSVRACLPLSSRRDAEPFEILRAGADAFLTRTGERPKVFLCVSGPLDASAAAVAWLRTLFAAAGLECCEPISCAAAETLDSFGRSGAIMACVCAPPGDERAIACAEILRDAGARRVFLMARPEDIDEPWRVAGFADLVYPGCDLLAVLETASAYTA